MTGGTTTMPERPPHVTLTFPTIAILAVLMITTTSVLARPPPETVQCANDDGTACTIRSTYGTWPDRKPCTAARAAFPSTEAELVAAVASAVKEGQKIKVISHHAHSIPKLACPGGSDGLVISTRDYNTRILFDRAAKTVEVDAGVQLQQLIDAAAAVGLALPYAPYWSGISISGLISTGAHGSSMYQKGSAVHEYVKAIRLVVPASAEEGYAKVVELKEGVDDEELDAARVSLGVLGAISTVKLQLEPMFKRSITNVKESDDDLEDKVLDFAEAYEFGDFAWHPSQKSVVYKKDFRVPISTDGDGQNDFAGFQGFDVQVIEAVRALETSFEVTDNPSGKCVDSNLQVGSLLLVANGLKNNKLLFTGYPVIGYHNKLQASSACLNADDHDNVCAWDSSAKGEFFHQTTVAIPVKNLTAFIKDVKALRDLHDIGLCNVDLYYGIWVRFLKKSRAYLGEQSDVVSFDMTYYRAHEAGRPRLNEDIWEEIEQMAIFKYGGHPHWGKNRPIAFIDIANKHPDMSRFLAVKNKFDPNGLFSSEWSDAMLGLLDTPPGVGYFDGCALEGLCICSEDSHCAPHENYLCQPGRVYKEARVCRKVSEPLLEKIFHHDEL